MFKFKRYLIFFAFLALSEIATAQLRVVVSSDFPPLDVCMSGCSANHTSDPDDVQSMVRFLLYTNEFDVEGLIASSGTFANVANKQNILDIINLYAKVYDNLKAHDSKYPSPEHLRSVTFQGRSGTWGGTVDNNIGAGKDSQASDSIIRIVDKPDPRPVWFCFWGDCSNLAQAIWKVKNTRDAAELKKFLDKIRIYQIAHQDNTIDWLMSNFPNLFIIFSQNTWQGMFGGPSDPLGNLSWINANIRQNHGPLGAVYPPAAMGVDGVKEGDSPSFLYLVSAAKGISNSENPAQASWGGQYVRSGSTNHWVDGPGTSSVSKWKTQYQADFANRAEWMLDSFPTEKFPRVINMTDLGADPDDQQSMVRFLTMSNEYDVEGLIVCTSCWKQTQSSTAMLDNIVNAYGQVLPNLSIHAPGFPSLAYLQSVSKLGQPGFGMADVGAGKDSPGSNLIIAAVDKEDSRPVWINCWGGANTLAQALWKVKNTRTSAEVEKFVGKLRVYDILGQDDAGAWMTKTFPQLFYIRFLSVYSWQPTDDWVAANVQSKGPLGAVYPNRAWAIEGDTPSFLYEYANGLSDPAEVNWGSWGGRCDSVRKSGVRGMTGGASYNEAQYDSYYMFSDAAEGGSSISRWSTAINNDFAARMIWSITGNYGDANHFPFAVVNGDSTRQVLRITAAPGSMVKLSALGSSDPDGNSLLYKWTFYKEASTFSGNVAIQNYSTATPTVSVPSNANGTELHIMLELHDTGSPSLYAYRRVIIDVGYPTAVREGGLGQTQSAPVVQSYPNPSGEITNIKVSLPVAGLADVAVFSLDGRLVENIYSGFLNQGIQILRWIPKSREEGIFICRLRFKDQECCSKIIRN